MDTITSLFINFECQFFKRTEYACEYSNYYSITLLPILVAVLD